MRSLTAFALFALFSPFAIGQEQRNTARTENPPVQFQVLKSWKVDVGDRSIFLNRVAPPVLPTGASVVAEPAPPPSAEDLEIARRRRGKATAVLFLSATVYDRKFTEIRGMDGRHEYRAASNIDFNLIPCMGTFESDDTVYSLLLATSNQGTDANGMIERSAPGIAKTPTLAERFPKLAELSPTRAQYLPLETATGALPEENDLKALDALHAFFEANRERLAADYTTAEAARIEQEGMPKEPPPKPKDIIINYSVGEGATADFEKLSRGVRP